MSLRHPAGDQAPEHRDGPVRRALAGWRQWARRLKRETYAVYLALRDPRLPWYARLVALLVAGYAFSPIDLIPDFIPVFGYLDDLVLVPLGAILAVKMIPVEVMTECRDRAAQIMAQGKPVNKAAAIVIVLIWVGLAVVVGVVVYRLVVRR